MIFLNVLRGYDMLTSFTVYITILQLLLLIFFVNYIDRTFPKYEVRERLCYCNSL